MVVQNLAQKMSALSGSPKTSPLFTVFGAVLLMAVGYTVFELNAPLNHDVAWLLYAGSRWLAGDRLYVDIVDLQPPLVFYVYGALTLGTFQKSLFIAGVVAAMAASSVWAARLQGARWGVATFIVCCAAGILDFGQRDHLAAITAIPYLWANRAGARERAMIGIWSFIGFGLKPYLMLIPAGATLARMVQERSIRPILSPENVVIGLLCVVYLAAVAIAYPGFFTDIIPLARLVYFAYGASFGGEPVTLPLLGLAVAMAAISATRRELWPEVGALVGAILSYFVQGRFWTYHLVPALALAYLLLLLLVSLSGQRRLFARTLMLLAALAILLFTQFRRHYVDLVPPGATSVLFLSPHVGSAFPAALDRGVIHASPYPAIWTLPGAWRVVNDPGRPTDDRVRAQTVLDDTRRILVDEIRRHCPDPIFADIRERKPYFEGPFDYIAFLRADPRFTGYRAGERIGVFRVYHRVRPCPRSGASRTAVAQAPAVHPE